MKTKIISIFLVILSISFVLASTTIKLQEPNTENLNDAFFDEDETQDGLGHFMIMDLIDGTGEIPFIMFNIASIPEGQIITNATLCLYLYYGLNTPFDLWRSNNNTWDETDVDDWCNNGVVCQEVWDKFTTKLGSYNGPSANGFYCMPNLQSAIQTEYNLGNKNITFVMNNTGDPANYYAFYSKEYTSDTSHRPYLNITYEDAPEIPYSRHTYLKDGRIKLNNGRFKLI